MAAPGKIVLKSSTKISLNDRFTGFMKSRPVTTVSIRAQVASDRLASEKNRRLAQQMERRPSVAAELGTRPGGSVRDRLGVAPARGGRGRGGRGFLRGRGRGRVVRGRGQTRGSPRGRSFSRGRGFSRGRSPRGTRGNSRGISRGGRGRGRVGRGRIGRGGPNNRPTPDKQKLDDQLDSYMNKTKGALNADLDAYMAGIDK